ncbi:MAG: hypothetical protein IJU48_08670 [Synergistaceae bacterium]|nr:hypothetical protein [Synergistaceae bacterium]
MIRDNFVKTSKIFASLFVRDKIIDNFVRVSHKIFMSFLGNMVKLAKIQCDNFLGISHKFFM